MDYLSTILQTQKHMLSDQMDKLFDSDGTLRSVLTVSKVFEGRKTAKDSLFQTGYEQLLLHRTSTTTLTAQVNSKLNQISLQRSRQNNRQHSTPN
jgi:hypothetical protein